MSHDPWRGGTSTGRDGVGESGALGGDDAGVDGDGGAIDDGRSDESDGNQEGCA